MICTSASQPQALVSRLQFFHVMPCFPSKWMHKINKILNGRWLSNNFNKTQNCGRIAQPMRRTKRLYKCLCNKSSPNQDTQLTEKKNAEWCYIKQINIALAPGWDWFHIFGVYSFTWLPLIFVRSFFVWVVDLGIGWARCSSQENFGWGI